MRMRDNRLEQKEKNVMHAITVDRLALPPCLLKKDEVCKANRLMTTGCLVQCHEKYSIPSNLNFLGETPDMTSCLLFLPKLFEA